MNQSQLLEKAIAYLDLEDSARAIILLEKCIENNSEEVNYYWYLGLAYLLQEQEENAQATWLLVMSQGDENQVKQWNETLSTILDTQAHRQEQIGNLTLSWLIRGYIREIEPSLVNNLLHLIDLEIQLQSYDPQHLEKWKVVDYLLSKFTETVDSELLLKIIPNILDFPVFINIDFLYNSLKYITNTDALISILISTAIKMAYERNKADYAVDLTKVCLHLQPNNLELMDQLYWFSSIINDYDQMLQSSKDFLSHSETIEFKAFGYYKVIQSLIARGAWLKSQEILPLYVNFLQEMITFNPKSIDSIMRGSLQSMASPLLYLQDNPLLYRQLQNQLSSLFQRNISSYLSFSSVRNNFDYHYPRTLKIGYISHTLRRHSVGWLSRWLLHYHNREQFQISLYLINQLEDDITQIWFREKVDFIYNFPHSPEKIAAKIQQDEIDILVDLDSFSHAVTCQVLALKPATIQVTWLGFDASGLPAIDYFIADPYILPDNAQEYYQETIWRLPQTYLAINGFEVAVPTLKRENLGIPNEAIIYLSVQIGEKRHPDNIHLQMQVLQAVPNSYLLIKGRANQAVIKALFKEISEKYDVAFDRLRFLESSPSEEIHRANLTIADVILDTYPYNGATTTLEALWMETPLVTKVGQQFAARNSYTFMTNAGLTEGIAWTDEEYVDWGIRLGIDENLRQQISCKLRQSKKNAPLWNAKQFTQEMEKAYQQMWFKYLDSFLT